jgi:hypothetical protein
VGAILDDLDDREGNPLRRLTDGTTTSRGTSATDRFTGYIAACDCGWTGARHCEPTEAGYDAALDEWEHNHAYPLLEYAIPDWVQQQLQDALRSLDELAAQRPRAAAKALRHLDAGRTAIARRLDDRLAAHEPALRRAVLRRQQPGLGLGL